MSNRLTEMLQYRRPCDSSTENAWIKHFIDTVPGMQADPYGNRYLLRESKTIIAVHTDSVHRTAGKQRIKRDKNGIISLADPLSNCLGADDAAGCYAALRMIEAGVKATFVFHRREEIGGRGSDWITANHADWCKGFDRVVSLDRRRTGDIITSQSTGTCCSDEFALALGDALGMGHKPAAGIFTDSANYTHLVSECSNISVGYYNEHTTKETLDTHYLERLIERLCIVDWDGLPVVRDPAAIDPWSLWDIDSIDACDYCGMDDGTLTASGDILCQYCREALLMEAETA